MVEKTKSSNKNIVVVLTIEECNVFRNLCTEFLGSYKLNLSRNRALAIDRILDKLEKKRK